MSKLQIEFLKKCIAFHPKANTERAEDFFVNAHYKGSPNAAFIVMHSSERNAKDPEVLEAQNNYYFTLTIKSLDGTVDRVSCELRADFSVAYEKFFYKESVAEALKNNLPGKKASFPNLNEFLEFLIGKGYHFIVDLDRMTAEERLKSAYKVVLADIQKRSFTFSSKALGLVSADNWPAIARVDLGSIAAEAPSTSAGSAIILGGASTEEARSGAGSVVVPASAHVPAASSIRERAAGAFSSVLESGRSTLFGFANAVSNIARPVASGSSAAAPHAAAPTVDPNAPRAFYIDTVLVLDISASMSSQLSAAKKQLAEIAKRIQKENEGAKLRISVIAYSDYTDEYRNFDRNKSNPSYW
ncbi:MAG: hypothetical protein ACKOAD_06410, partial [Gammaproteobacteria bacterium]